MNNFLQYFIRKCLNCKGGNIKKFYYKKLVNVHNLSFALLLFEEVHFFIKIQHF